MTILNTVVHKLTWKSAAVDAYTTALLRAAVSLREKGIVYFNNDDVAEDFQPLDKTTVGVAFKLLLHEVIITQWRDTIASADIWGGYRRSTRRVNNGHRNQLYSLANRSLARTWLVRHGVVEAPRQLDLTLN